MNEQGVAAMAPTELEEFEVKLSCTIVSYPYLKKYRQQGLVGRRDTSLSLQWPRGTATGHWDLNGSQKQSVGALNNRCFGDQHIVNRNVRMASPMGRRHRFYCINGLHSVIDASEHTISESV